MLSSGTKPFNIYKHPAAMPEKSSLPIAISAKLTLECGNSFSLSFGSLEEDKTGKGMDI